MSQEPISIIVLEPVVDSMAALVRALEQTPQVELITVPSVAEAHQVALQFQPCVMLISLRGSLDGAMQVELLKKVEKPIRSGQVKPLIISTVKNHPMAGVISTIGVKDYVVEPTTTKSLMFKMNLFFKAINAQRDKAAAALKNNETRVFKAKPAEEEKANTISSTKAIGKYKPALQLAEDTFLFKRAQPRKINSKILLEAEGPSPETGEWVQQPSKPNEIQKWKWKPKVNPGEEGVDQDEGSGWIHEGEKPSFSGNPGRWLMSSTKPRLDYFRGGQAVANKVETDENGEVIIADDSQAAKENLVLNKTLAQQAQELQLKKALEEQEAEELKKLMVVEKPKAKVEQAKSGSSFEEEEKDSFATLAKKIRDKKRISKAKNVSGTVGDEDDPEWNDNSAGEKSTTPGSRQKIKADKQTASLRNLELDSEEEEIQGSAANLRLETKETLPEGLDQNDLESDKNRRKAAARDLQRKMQGEKLAEGLAEEQLEDEVNLREKRNLKPGDKRLEAEQEKDGDEELDALERKNKSKQRLKRELAARGESKPKLTKEELEKLAEQKIKDILALMAEEEKVPVEEEKEDLSPEKLQERKEKLGLKAGDEVDPKELRRLEKAERVKKQRKEIAELEEAIKAGEGPLQAIFFAEEGQEWNREEEKAAAAKERNFRAIESADSDLYERDEILSALKKRKQEGVFEAEAGKEYFYLLQSEVQPEHGDWIYAEEQWLYLGASTLESGFENLEDILPTWVFDGLEQPVLLKEEKKWRFSASAPYLVQSAGEISFALKDALKGYTKAKLERENRKLAVEKREREEAEKAEAQSRKREIPEEDLLEKNAPPRVFEKVRKDKIFSDAELETPSDEAPLELAERNKTQAASLGEVTRELEDQPALGKVVREDASKSGFGKVQLEEMLKGDTGKVRVEGLVNSEAGLSFEESEQAKDFKFNVKELLVFVKINDAKRSSHQLEGEISKILHLMHLAYPHLHFECVRDTAPLALAKPAEALHAADCLLVTTTAEDGKFSSRDKIISFHFAKALALLLAQKKLKQEAEAA